MPVADATCRAELIESIHAPWQATVGECLQRWSGLDAATRSHSYLVLRGEAGARQTLNAAGVAELAMRLSPGLELRPAV